MGRHRRQTVDMLGSRRRQTVVAKINVFHRLAAVATEFQRSGRSFVMVATVARRWACSVATVARRWM